ncbi:hypothetical protein [Streptacidiphilus fuscans]|uniref:Uncharacterized protein n=1 Tax=Streptacidiphilus fuscans TaxID=2789292 RepID=A0A931FDE7_9ACTN|nr:hypothetical protein [Streptacidiphilus fuscans]MBF9068075.1 hypothetical protein [Streptacidiphilus fuscans]
MSRTRTGSSGRRSGAHERRAERYRLQGLVRRRARIRTRGRWCLAFAVLTGFVSLCMPFGVHSAYVEETAFDRAVPCAPDAPASFTDCLSRSTDVIVSKRETTGKGAREYVSVDVGTPSPAEISFGSRAFYSRLTVGESIGVTVWRQRFVRLDDAFGSTDTDGDPSGDMQLTLALGIAALGAAAWLGYLSFWYLRRTERCAAIPAPPALVLAARALYAGALPLFVGFVVLVSTRGGLSPAASLVVVPLSYSAVLLLAASTLVFRWMRRPGEVHFKR